LLSNQKKRRETACFTFLSPVRLPFRHTGCGWNASLTGHQMEVRILPGIWNYFVRTGKKAAASGPVNFVKPFK
jgi:hypothetical protein